MELLRRIKSDPRLRELPVIMQTAAATPNQVREGLQSGAHYYLTKAVRTGHAARDHALGLDELRNRRDLADRIHAQKSAIALVRRGTYEVRTLEEAQILAAISRRSVPSRNLRPWVFRN
jgi:CheY-like chemotaxis protein